MKNLSFFLFALIALNIFSSCDKDDSNDNPKLITYFFDYNINIANNDTLTVPVQGDTIKLYSTTILEGGIICPVYLKEIYLDGGKYAMGAGSDVLSERGEAGFSHIVYSDQPYINWDLKKPSEATLIIKPNDTGQKRLFQIIIWGGVTESYEFSKESNFYIIQEG